jgi:carboxypeptidase family protein
VRSTGVAACATFLVLMLLVRETSAQGRATLDGVVVGPSGAPQPNITLVVTNAAGIDRRAVSDANGQFVFGGLQPGVYRLRTDDETFAPFSQDQITLAGGQTQTIRVALQPRVPVAAPQTARATLQGTVIGPEGRPIGNTTIILTNPQGIDRRAVSESTGAYVFGGLQPGTYRLRIEDPGPGVQPFPAMELPLAPGEQRQFDVRLQPSPPPATSAPTTTTPAGDERVRQIGPTRREPSRARTPPPEAPAVPEVTAPGGDFEAVPNRWNYKWAPYQRYQNEPRQPWVVGRPLDPYNQNPAKADFPIGGSSSLFANVNLQLNSALNPRRVGDKEPVSQVFSNNNFVGGVELFRGATVFEPKRWAVRGTVVGNVNRLSTAAKLGRTYGVEEAFAEKRLTVLGPSFDFVSIRGGMQNFNSDFRGFLFVDNQLGVRLFGNARANRDQYNVVYFSMRDRDPVSQLHKFTSRNQDVVIANYYVQDIGTPGYTFMANVHLSRDRGVEADPHALQVTYAGFHGDGKWGPLSVSHAFYEAFGQDDDNAVARALTGTAAPVDISARMAALELSWDADWRRYRFSWFYASGDNAADSGKATGFDSITDNPNLAGGQFMFWDQQKTNVDGLPLNDLLKINFSLLPSLRNKFNQRSNFVNPGLMLVNGGVDLRLSPKLRVVTNVSHLRFADPSVVRELLLQAGSAGFEDSSIGWDVGAGAKLRPFVNENLFVVLGFSLLKPGDGLASALGSTQPLHSFVGAIQLAY